jgi:hypothetical protein
MLWGWSYDSLTQSCDHWPVWGISPRFLSEQHWGISSYLSVTSQSQCTLLVSSHQSFLSCYSSYLSSPRLSCRSLTYFKTEMGKASDLSSLSLVPLASCLTEFSFFIYSIHLYNQTSLYQYRPHLFSLIVFQLQLYLSLIERQCISIISFGGG